MTVYSEHFVGNKDAGSFPAVRVNIESTITLTRFATTNKLQLDQDDARAECGATYFIHGLHLLREVVGRACGI